MKHFKTYSITLIVAPFLLLMCVIAANLAMDPDHIFSKGRDYPFFSRGLPFYKNAGIINNHDIKNIIIGGSIMDNFIPSEVEKAMGWQDVYALTADGSSQKDLAVIAQYAMHKHSVQNVLLGLLPERLTKPIATQGNIGKGAKHFAALYDESRLNDLRVFVQAPQYFTRNLSRGHRQRKGINAETYPGFQEKDLLTASKDLYAHYMGYYNHYNRPLFVSSLASMDKEPVPLTDAEKQTLLENYKQYVEPLVRDNPQTHFYIVIPPGTFLSKHEDRYTFPYALKFLVENLSSYSNVKIYGFANDAFNADLRLYSDFDHYHIEIARYMIQSLARDNHRITAANVDKYIQQFNHIMDHYKIPSSWKTQHFKNGDGPYPKEGYLTYRDAARLVWGPDYSDKLYSSMYRSPYLDEKTYVENKDIKTQPPLQSNLLELPDNR